MTTSLDICPLCRTGTPALLLTLADVPVICNQLWPDVASARVAPVATVELVQCQSCALVWNRRFDPTRIVYAPGYENALHFSPKFRDFAENLAADLVSRHDLRSKDVIEIGCGDGYMLDLMVKHGAGTAVGFDPSMANITSPFTARDGVEIVPEYFRSEQLDRPFDAVICRHLVEHLDDPLGLCHDIRSAIGGRMVPIYIEVPNAGWLLDTVSLWDVIYEHITYWTVPAMDALLQHAGFNPVRITEGYGRQFLMAEGLPAERTAEKLDKKDASPELARGFATAAAAEIAEWHKRLAATSGPVVVWGAGSKGITFANVLGTDEGKLVAMVDLNNRKHGLVTPGVALPVIAPAELSVIRPELVVIANGLYEPEIREQVATLGLDPDFAVLTG